MTDQDVHIENVLKRDTHDIAFEPIPDENSSPLVQPVVSKNSTSETVQETRSQSAIPNPQISTGQNQAQQAFSQNQQQDTQTNTKPLDAPEQEINGNPQQPLTDPSSKNPENGEFTVPLSHATMMADSLLGMTNNILEVGGGYFVTISKEKEFFDFDELIQVIDEQNVKNIKRIKLDEEDKDILRPLLIVVLRKQSKVLSPEQQLIGVCVTILIKKAKLVMEIRSENEALVDRISDIIRKELAQYRGSSEHTDTKNNANEQGEQEQDPELTNQDLRDQEHPDILPGSIPPVVFENTEV